ncbi:MAG TPA: L,D-transpeptidase family protein [Anaerolineae bacterium]|nr:L,D-transpeptidase family protein [Anaerolineae bacterium]
MLYALTRREFLKFSALSACGLAILPPEPAVERDLLGLGRVTVSWIYLYDEPSFQAKRLTRLSRDMIVTLLERETSDDGPPHNPLWYRVPDGFVHSGNIQRVRWEPQSPRLEIPESGALFEVSVPFTRSYRKPDQTSDPLYRLYFQSVAWVEAVEPGANGRLWYRLLDDILKVNYYVRAEHLRRIEPEELTPISPDVPLHAKRILVSLAQQELLAFENERLVLRTRISSGIPDYRPRGNGIPTATPTGRFYITKKTPLRHMGDCSLTDSLEAYELPGVPWVSFFYETGVAFHGTYWHTDFGRPKSHGCVNMHTEEAKWLFRWASPIIEADVMLKAGHGTSVIVV